MSTSLSGSKGMGATGSSMGKAPTGYDLTQLQNYSPDQMKLFSSLFSHVQPDSYTSRLAGGDESAFQQAEAPAHREFEQGLGTIAGRFSGFSPGAMGAQRGSGFKQATAGYASDFGQQLASKRMSLQQNAIRELLGMSHELLGQRPSENVLTKQDKPFWQELLLAGTGAGGHALGGWLGG